MVLLHVFCVRCERLSTPVGPCGVETPRGLPPTLPFGPPGERSCGADRTLGSDTDRAGRPDRTVRHSLPPLPRHPRERRVQSPTHDGRGYLWNHAEATDVPVPGDSHRHMPPPHSPRRGSRRAGRQPFRSKADSRPSPPRPRHAARGVSEETTAPGAPPLRSGESERPCGSRQAPGSHATIHHGPSTGSPPFRRL